MAPMRFYLDEDCQSLALQKALQAHGIDVTTVNQAGTGGDDDESQLQYAANDGRIFVSNNAADFCVIHQAWAEAGRTHCGIVLFPQQQYSIGDTVRRLLRLSQTLTAQDMCNRLEWLSGWGEG